MDLSSITGSPIVKNLLMKQLKGYFKDANITLITISLDSKNELDFKAYTDDVQVIKTTDLNDMQDFIKSEMEGTNNEL